jgi:hypothetical protein
VWGLELANAISVGERRGRLAAEEVEAFIELLEHLNIDQDVPTVIKTIRSARMLARKYEHRAFSGSACIRGMRIRVSHVVGLGRSAAEFEEILVDYSLLNEARF